MATALIAIVVVPLLMASWTLVRNTAQNRANAKVETVLNNAADRVNRAPPSCNYSVYYQAAALTQGWSANAVTVNYQYFVPGATAQAAGTWVNGACPGSTRPDGLVQLVTITVANPDGNSSRTMQVVKSNV